MVHVHISVQRLLPTFVKDFITQPRLDWYQQPELCKRRTQLTTYGGLRQQCTSSTPQARDYQVTFLRSSLMQRGALFAHVSLCSLGVSKDCRQGVQQVNNCSLNKPTDTIFLSLCPQPCSSFMGDHTLRCYHKAPSGEYAALPRSTSPSGADTKMSFANGRKMSS
eukprot:293367-Amphidinium_carterae.1